MQPRIAICLLILGLTALPAFSATADYSIQVSATAQSSPPQITLNWPLKAVTSDGYAVFRKTRDAVVWGNPIATGIPATATGFTDGNVAAGQGYEYRVVAGLSNGFDTEGYVYSGIELPLIETRGKILLVVEDLYAADLALELARLQQDLSGDGWTPVRIDVKRTATVKSIKQTIVAAYQLDPANTKGLLLFGRVPVPYSGLFSSSPDGHSQRRGAWPTDTFYAEMDGLWTDSGTETGGLAKHDNFPNDGKYDQHHLPSDLELAVGRVDLSSMPAFALNERELLRQYLNKDHNFRHKLISAQRRGLIDDNFGTSRGIPPFSASGLRSFSALFGAANVTHADWFTTLGASSYLWAYGCGGGTYTSAGGIGTTANFAATDTQVVFSMLFGSAFGDWDSTDNFLRAPLATQTYGLASAWSGKPLWMFHHMGMGEPIGFSSRLNQNCPSDLYGGGLGAADFSRAVSINLMGDPTLRLHIVAPPTAFSGNAGVLTWTAPAGETVLGYNLYRANASGGPFSKLNTGGLIAATTYNDAPAAPGIYTYMLKAVKLETGSGTYYNSSQGVFTTQTVAHPDGLPEVRIESFAAIHETAGARPAFVVSRSGATTASLTVSYNVSGTAVAGTDYTALPGTIQIPAGAVSVTFNLTPVNDTLLRGDRTVVLTLAADAAYHVGSPATAVCTIVEDELPVVGVAATDPTATEPADTGEFTFTRQGDTAAPVQVIFGTSFTASPYYDYEQFDVFSEYGGAGYDYIGTATIPAGATSVTVPVMPIDDDIYRGTRPLTVTVVGTTQYVPDTAAASATVTIMDNEPEVLPSIYVSNPNKGVEEGTGLLNIPRFWVHRTDNFAGALTVHYTLSGTAVSGQDYATPTGSVTIHPGTSATEVFFIPIDDALVEGDETIIVTILPDPNYRVAAPSSTTMLLNDGDTPQISMSVSGTANEVGPTNATVTFTRSANTGGQIDLNVPLAVTYTVAGTATSGTDYAPLSGIAVFNAGSSTATVIVAPVNDAVIEGNESVVITPQPGAGYYPPPAWMSSLTVFIADDPAPAGGLPVVHFSTTQPANGMTVEGDPAVWATVVRASGPAAALTVNYSVSGTATSGEDYTPMSGTLTIPAIAFFGTQLPIDLLLDSVSEPPETIILTLEPSPNYLIGSNNRVEFRIIDHYSMVEVTASAPLASETGTPGEFTLTRTGETDQPITIHYTLTGSATYGADYPAIPSSVTIRAGAASTTLEIEPAADGVGEGSEQVTITLTHVARGVAGLGQSRSAFVTIREFDPPTAAAGTDQQVTLPALAALSGSANDDGLPGPLTTTWSLESGPGSVTFGDAANLTTTAEFSVSGDYVLKLTVSDGAFTISDTLSVTVLPANVVPEIASLSAAPNPALVQQMVAFSAVASDADGDTLTYVWDFGDGTSANGAGSGHAYAAAGIYTAIVTVADGRGGLDQRTIIVTIQNPPPPPPPDNDPGGTVPDGNPGIPDGGTPDGTPGIPDGGTAIQFRDMQVAKLLCSAKFTATGKDSCAVSGTLPDVAAFNPKGVEFSVDIGGARETFVLDAKGRGKSARGTVMLKLGKKFAGGNVPFSVKLKNGAWTDDWADEGMDPAQSASKQPATIDVTVSLNGEHFKTGVPALCSTVAGKSGKLTK